ncbi:MULTISPECIES: response regulator transcription factor [Salinibaculum]|uniref:response regulator transcription factor n=1 Tax=Salinibaculum TaxID=2732368 RepID=UPI0030CAE532
MTPTSEDRRVVLVVDDEAAIADTFAFQLQGPYETRVAYGGEEALEMVDESVAAVLLDRRMPDIHGDEVLAEIRDRGLDCVVIMTTAVDPDLNILAMDFDDYLCKPVTGETLLETLDQHVGRPDRAEGKLDEFFSIDSKLSVLEAEKTPAELADSEEYERLERRAERLESELREELADFDDLLATYRDIDRGT